MDPNVVIILSAFLGVVARVFVPWLIARVKSPDLAGQFNFKKYVLPQLLLVVILVLLAPVVSDIEVTLEGTTPVGAYLAGWGAADLGKTAFLDGLDLLGVVKK